MQAGPSNSDRLVCICRQYCHGQPRLVSEATFYRHLANAVDSSERIQIQAVRGMTLDAARIHLQSNPPSHASVNQNQFSQPQADSATFQRTSETAGGGPGPYRSLNLLRKESLRALQKRAREAADELVDRKGKRKHARNRSLNVRFNFFITAIKYPEHV